MNMPTESAVAERRGVPTFAVEAAVAILVFVLGLTVILGSRKLGSTWTSDGPGAGYFPFYIGLILCISALGILFQSLVGKRRNNEIFVDSEQLRRVLTVLVPALIFVGFIQLVGMYIAAAVYIAGFMIILGKFSPLKSVITALSVAVLFFMLFEVWFKVPLAKGALNPFGFLGY